MTKTNARRAVRRYIAHWLRNDGSVPPDIGLPEIVTSEWPEEIKRIADRIERGDLVQGHRLRLE